MPLACEDALTYAAMACFLTSIICVILAAVFLTKTLRAFSMRSYGNVKKTATYFEITSIFAVILIVMGKVLTEIVTKPYPNLTVLIISNIASFFIPTALIVFLSSLFRKRSR